MAAHKNRFSPVKGRRNKSADSIMKFASLQKSDNRTKSESDAKPVVMPRPPVLIGAYARKEWDRCVALLRERGMLDPMYMTPLTAYCNAWGIMMKASAHLGKTNSEYVIKAKESGCFYQSQWLVIYNKAEEKVYKYSALFGFSPNDALRMKAAGQAPDAPKKMHNPFDDL